MTVEQALFLDQQLMALKAKGPRGRRWHPTMIRFALSIYHKSPGTYAALCETLRPPLASKILTFFIKGVSSNIKEAVATFGVDTLTKEQLYRWSWDVITKLERAGIAIIAFISDGSPINRAFIKMNKPYTENVDVVFDTVNKENKVRCLYFIADTPHLLKTIRNCFYSSSEKRYLNKGNENLKWENTEETITFIRKVNRFFDMLNGAHSQQGARKKNSDLDPYCSLNDERFNALEDFVQYLEEWKRDAEAAVAANKTVNESINVSAGNVDDPGEDQDNVLDIEEGDVTQDPACIKQLSHQTIEGIKITVYGFTKAVKFLLMEGVLFVNARVFCQDPLEQYFSKQRSKCGGSTNPNLSQSLRNQRSISIQGQLKTKRNYRGNTEVESQSMAISNEPLPKKQKTS
ncbi:hypothetical protein ONE63_000060 [Megalurothrips usitatus]|uniref:Transposable element P transposase-like RNase H domain-containing protein n=1 Tax=Megalurothrips usitatus TaxID=439358 RepID=A0AAV7XZT1_9NEOP|nr:hypothetical protein ONE63_000060 [Megalurothrips usitatus]